MSKDTWISTSEAAVIMGVTDRWVRRMAEKGEIEHMRVGKTWIISRRAALEFVRQRAPKNGGKNE